MDVIEMIEDAADATLLEAALWTKPDCDAEWCHLIRQHDPRLSLVTDAEIIRVVNGDY